MSKKVYVVVEIIKIFILSWLVAMVYDASISSISSDHDLAIIGYTFLIMLATVIIGSIILHILVSIFTPKEKKIIGEWEKLINKNLLRNFAYMLSLFSGAVMLSFALEMAQQQIILIFRIGFFLLISTTNLTKAYYYEG